MGLKIVYAAGNREGAALQLQRFLEHVPNHVVKIAAYTKSNPGLPVDWNLDSLKNIFLPDNISYKNENFVSYYEQIKYFDPDLIISDLEIYTSYIANVLNKRIWQVSPNLLHQATAHKDKVAIGLFKYYPNLFKKNVKSKTIQNIIFNSDKNLVYSHFGDTQKIQLLNGFEWVRPYYTTGKISLPCRHAAVATCFYNNKKFIDYLKKYKDTVLFSNFIDEKFSHVILKSIYEYEEYGCNLKNSDIFVSQGHTDFLADAFYNGKQCYILPNFLEIECVMNALYSKYLDTASAQFNSNEDQYPNVGVVNYDANIKFLHQKVEEL